LGEERIVILLYIQKTLYFQRKLSAVR